ncbi:MAG: hypothetical protein AAF646_13755 [Pseudomonadota bacterium]
MCSHTRWRSFTAALVLACLSAGPVASQEQPPDYFVEAVALLRVASHMAAQCEDVQVDLDADSGLRVGVYGLLDRDGWSIDDPRLHSETTRDAVLALAESRYADLGLATPLESAEVCPVARAEAMAQSVLGRLFRVDGP